MDGSAKASPLTKREFITAENINSLFAKYGVPTEFDVLSIDIDYNTYWVWKALERWRPRVVVIEYNGYLSPEESKTVQYDPNGKWEEGQYFGANLLALAKLGASKGYDLIGCETSGTNAFFVRKDLVSGHFVLKETKEAYRPAIGEHGPADVRFINV